MSWCGCGWDGRRWSAGLSWRWVLHEQAVVHHNHAHSTCIDRLSLTPPHAQYPVHLPAATCLGSTPQHVQRVCLGCWYTAVLRLAL